MNAYSYYLRAYFCFFASVDCMCCYDCPALYVAVLFC